jgi:hypothetical protein
MKGGTESNSPDSPFRRKTIKTLAAGVGALAGTTVLPDRWVTPIIQGIVLPAHAQTSATIQLAFCNAQVDLQLLSGDSGSSSITIKATGCITPAQTNVPVNLRLDGYEEAHTTDAQDFKHNSILSAVSDALVPEAHAAQQPLCSQSVKVSTAGDGSFEAEITLSCGPGIAQVELEASSTRVRGRQAGRLDVSGSCRSEVEPVEVAPKLPACDAYNVPYSAWGVAVSTDGITYEKSGVLSSCTVVYVKNIQYWRMMMLAIIEHSDGVRDFKLLGYVNPGEYLEYELPFVNHNYIKIIFSEAD